MISWLETWVYIRFMVNVKSKWKSSYVALIKKVFFIVKQHFWGYYCKQDIFLNEKCFFFIIDIWGVNCDFISCSRHWFCIFQRETVSSPSWFKIIMLLLNRGVNPLLCCTQLDKRSNMNCKWHLNCRPVIFATTDTVY